MVNWFFNCAAVGSSVAIVVVVVVDDVVVFGSIAVGCVSYVGFLPIGDVRASIHGDDNTTFNVVAHSIVDGDVVVAVLLLFLCFWCCVKSTPLTLARMSQNG